MTAKTFLERFEPSPTFVGIGDLHLDGRLQKYLPNGVNLNKVIIDEVRTVLDKVRPKGVNICVLYGDVGDKPQLTDDAHMRLIDLFRDYRDLFMFLVCKGNHDHRTTQRSGLDLLSHMRMPNVSFALNGPVTYLDDTDNPIILHPWPHHDTVGKGATNVLHIETKGSLMDSGRPSPHGAAINKKHFWVAGHLHTNHLNYSGTLYQTTFGEKKEKFFHLVDRVNQKVKSVPHKPLFTLENIVIESREDLETTIPTDPNTLVKLFIKSKVVVPDQLLDKYPNVVKHNSFKTKEELQSLVMEDFVIDDVSGAANFDVNLALEDWLDSEKIDSRLKKRVLKLNSQITTQTSLSV